jgi:FkbM family methyltransferase
MNGKIAIQKKIYRALKKRGYAFHMHNLLGLYIFIEENQIEIKEVLDIGARTGEWSQYLRDIDSHLSFVLIEPNSIHNDLISKKGFEVHNELLSDKVKDVVFFSSGATGDSYYPELDENGKTQPYRKMKTITLDSFYDNNSGLPAPHLIKLDVQGAELDVIRGGKRTIKNSQIVLLELPVIAYNLGAPSLTETVNFMLRLNFVPVFLTEIHNIRGVIVQLDLAFMNGESFEKCFGSLETRGYWQTTKSALDLKS